MKMVKFLSVAVCLGVTAFGWSPAAHAIPTVIDFESFSDLDVIAAGTNLSGLEFNEDIQVFSALSLFPGSTGSQAGRFDPLFGDFSGSFDIAVSSLSMAVGDEGADIDTATLTGFNALNQVVDSDTYTAAVGQILSISGAGITHFTLVQVSLVVFDNVTFETDSVSVSEPGMLAVLGVALAGLGLSRRRKDRG